MELFFGSSSVAVKNINYRITETSFYCNDLMHAGIPYSGKLSRFGTKREFRVPVKLLCRCGPRACAAQPHSRARACASRALRNSRDRLRSANRRRDNSAPRPQNFTEKTFADGSEKRESFLPTKFSAIRYLSCRRRLRWDIFLG